MAEKWNLEKAKKFLAGEAIIFAHYYKYTFTFCGGKDGYNFSLGYGGDNDEIYRYELLITDEKKVGKDFTKEFYKAEISDEEGNVIFEHYDF